jgi:predicted nuclease of predicted toxin-antitoxin system
VRLLLDEHYADAIAEQLRARGHDAQTVSERGLKGLPDESLLALCHGESRALLTNNARDFVPLARQWTAAGREHAGILLTTDASLPRHRGNIGRYVEILVVVFDEDDDEHALVNQVRWLG